MDYRDGGRGGRGGGDRDRGDQRPPFPHGGGAGGGGGRSGCFVWPPPATTPRPVPAQHQMPMGYRAPMVLPHQVAYGPAVAVYRAPTPATPRVSFSPAPPAVQVTILAPPSSPSPAAPSSSAPAPRQVAQGAPTRVPEPAPSPSSLSVAALAKEVEKKLFVSETALTALAPPAAAASAAVAAAQGAASSDADAANVDLAPVSKKGLARPARPGLGTVGKSVMIRANHFLVNVANKNLFHYDVSINPESNSRATNREVLNELIKLHEWAALGGKLPAYDGRKSFYTAGSLPFESEEFVVTLVDPEKKEKERAEREYKITIRIAGRTGMYHLHQFLLGIQRDMPQETIQILDVVLRESPSWNYVTVSRSFFSTTFGHRGDIGEGLECSMGYYQILRPTQMGLSLNIDISATFFFKPVMMIKFVEFLDIRDTSRPLSDRDHVKIKKAPCGVHIETSHQPDQIRRYKITGITPIPMSQLIFPIDEKGTRQTIVQYFWDTLSAQEFGIEVSNDLVSVPARVLPPPMLKYYDSGREKVCAPSVGQWNMLNKKMVNGGTIDNWTCLNFSCMRPEEVQFCMDLTHMCNATGMKMINGGTIDNWTCLNFSCMRPEEVQRFCMDLTHMCNATRMSVNQRPFVEVKSAAPNHIENALRDVYRRADAVQSLTNYLRNKLAHHSHAVSVVSRPYCVHHYGEVTAFTHIGIMGSILAKTMGSESSVEEQISRDRIWIEFQILEDTVPVEVDRFCRVEDAASLAMRDLMVKLPDVYFMNGVKILPEGFRLCKPCTVDVQHRLRGGDTEKIHLELFIAKLIDQGNWMERVTIDPASQIPPGPVYYGACEVIGLAEGARRVLRMISDSLESKHGMGLSFGGGFGIGDMRYDPVSKSVLIDLPSRQINQANYMADEACLRSILEKFYCYENNDGTPGCPMLIGNLIAQITALNVNGQEYCSKILRSLIFNHPAMLSASQRIKLYDSLELHYHKLPWYPYGIAFRRALAKSIRDPLRWADPILNSGGALDMLARYNYKPPGRPKKTYDADYYGRMDFSRCYLTHFTKGSDKMADAALYVLAPDQLPELQRLLLVKYPEELLAPATASVARAVRWGNPTAIAHANTVLDNARFDASNAVAGASTVSTASSFDTLSIGPPTFYSAQAANSSSVTVKADGSYRVKVNCIPMRDIIGIYEIFDSRH